MLDEGAQCFFDTNCFSTRHQKCWHNGSPGVAECLHFWICNAWFGRHYFTHV